MFLKCSEERMTKLKDIDVELNELETDIANGNILHWARTIVINKVADEFVKEHSKELMAGVEIDNNELRQRVIDKIADEIIDNWKEKIGEAI